MIDQPISSKWVVLPLSAALLTLAGAFLWLRIATPTDGARLQPGANAWRADGVVVTPLVEGGGLRAGDVVIAVGGRSLESIAQSLVDFNQPRRPWSFGQAVTYTVRRDGQTLDVPLTLGRYPFAAVLRSDWGAILFALINLAVTSFVFYKRPDHRPAQLLFLAASSMMAATAWSFGLQISDFVNGIGYLLFKATTLGAYMLVWIAVLHFALTFPQPRPIIARHKWIVPLMYAAPYAAHAIYAPAARAASTTTLDWLRLMDADIGVLQLVYLALTCAAAVFSFRSARDTVSRLQLRWVTFAFVSALLLAMAAGVLPELLLGQPLLSWNVIALFGLLVPLSIAAAILRYRLFDIDIIINRAAVYGLLTAIVAAAYILIVGSLGAAFQARGNLFISLLATGLVAILFQPLRERLQRAVNRWMYGERDDPYAALSRLGQRLESALAPEAVLPALVETIAQSLKLPYAAIALRRGNDLAVAASYGLPMGEPFRLPLSYQGEAVGELILSPRAPDEQFTAGERRLLEDIARQAGVAAHAVQLTADLQRSRERLVTAREEERRRLRRDLHDGLGPTLAGLALRLDAARHQLAQDREAAAALLLELKAQTQSAIADIRRLAYDLRPPALDELGLAAALRQHIAQQPPAGRPVVTLDAPDLPPLPAAVEVAAYRIALEALTNALKHSQASRCAIRLAIRGQRSLEIEVADDGLGLPADRRAGVGLTSMRERAAELGGRCIIESAPGSGTRVWAALPVDHKA